MPARRLAALLTTAAVVAGGLALGSLTAHAAYAANGEPVWIPRNAANVADSVRADNRAVVRIGNVVYLGGDFTELAPELGAPAIGQGFLAAFNATTGVPVESFAPRLDGKVYAAVASDDGTTLYVGGAFTSVNGQPVSGFAALDAATGALRAGVTQRSAEGEVHSLYKDGSTLYVGGQFQRFGGASRKMIARIDLSQPTLAVDAWAPQMVGGMVAAIDIPPNHTRIYAGGRFTNLNGVDVGKVVALTPTTGELDAGFAPPFSTTKQPVEDIETTDAKVFVAFGGGYNRFVQFSASGTQEYGSCGDGDVQEVHLVNNGTMLLVGGHFAGSPKKNCTLATITTARIAEYDVTGPLPVPVAPTPFPNIYANELGVWEFLGDSLSDVWVAGDFLKASSRNTGGLAHFVDGTTYTDGQAPSTPTSIQVTGSSPGTLTVAWSPSTDNKAVAGYYVTADGVRGATTTGTTAVVRGLNPASPYSVQVQAFDVKLNTSALSGAVVGTTQPDTVPPAAPGNLRVESGSTSQLVLAWNASTDDGTVSGYRVYADGNLLTTTTTLTATHNGLAPGSEHQYQVAAVDGAGNVSAVSSTLSTRAYSVVLPAGSTWRYWDRGALPDVTWREPAYNDSTWASGRAPLGYGRSYIATTIGYGSSANNRYLTSYARTTFNLADATGVSGLTLSLRGTDGAAVFINGRLAANDNLPAALEPDLGALTVRDTAAKDIVRELRVPVTPGMLVPGVNVVAVEFHKYAPNSTYLAFETDISAGLPSAAVTPPPAPPTGLAATVVGGPAVQLGWTASSGAVSYQVFRNGELIGSASATSFTDTSPPAGATHSYTVTAIDGGGQESGASNAATATIPAADTTAPTVPGKPVLDSVTADTAALSWPASTDDTGVTGYRIFRNGTPLTTSAIPAFTDTGLTPATLYKYAVTAYDATGHESAKSSVLRVTTGTAPPADLILSPTTAWSYTETRVDLGTAWKDPGYVTDGATWKSGLPQLGFGDGDETTVLAKGGTTSTTAVFTWYFRSTFDVADPTAFSNLNLSLIRDDGAIVYLNGVEVYRTNMASGAATFTTKASSSVGGADEKNPVAFAVPASALVVGVNTIAVEVHNAGANNSDASFQLTAGLS